MTNFATDLNQFARSILPGSIVLLAILLQIPPEAASKFAHLYPVQAAVWLPLAILASYVLGQVIGCFSFDIMHQLVYSRLVNYDGQHWRFGKYSELKEQGFRQHLLDLCRVGNNCEVRDFFNHRFGMETLNYKDLYSMLNYCKTASAAKDAEVAKRLDKFEAKVQIPFSTFLPLVALAFSVKYSALSSLIPHASALAWLLVFLWLLFIGRSYYDRVDEARVTLWSYYVLFVKEQEEASDQKFTANEHSEIPKLLDHIEKGSSLPLTQDSSIVSAPAIKIGQRDER